jgi:hypothetical protein
VRWISLRTKDGLSFRLGAGEAADSATVRYREDLDIGFFVLGGLHALSALPQECMNRAHTLIATLLGFVALGAQASSLETGTQLRLALLAAESAALVLLGDWTVWIDSPTEGSARRVGPGLVLVSIGTLLSGAATVFVAIETYLAKRSGAKVRRVSNLGAVRGSSKASRSLYSAESGL